MVEFNIYFVVNSFHNGIIAIGKAGKFEKAFNAHMHIS